MHILRKDGKALCFKTKEIRKLLEDMIGMFEEILPIGSVVDLKKETLSENMDVSEIKQFRAAIVKRFIGSGEGCYYPYGAVVYPVGTAGTGRLISFTPALIENLVFTGYRDEVEEYFIYRMKQELIIRQGRKSAGFATKQELEKLRNSLAGGGRTVRMGELSKADAEKKRSSYITIIESVKKSVREDFEEMDFENAEERTLMEGYIKDMEEEYDGLVRTLDRMTFEQGGGKG